MKLIFTFFRLSILLILLVLTTNSIYAQVDKYLLDDCYNFHQYHAVYSGYYWFAMDIADEFVLKGGSSAYDNANFNEIDSFKLTPLSSNPLAIWQTYFHGIDQSNQALAYIEDIPANAQYRAEAKFVRAYCYFNLVRLFGGVPIITENCSTNPVNLVRATATEVYTQIENDLTEAIPYLPLKSALSATEKYRATKGAAHAVYAEACLYQHKWSEAATHLEAIINSNEYALMANFADLWLMANEHNSESIYELEFYSDKGYNWGNADWWSPESNPIVQLLGPNYQEVSITDNRYYNGWGFGSVTQGLVDLFDSQGDVIRKNATILAFNDIGTKLSTGYQNTGYSIKKYTTLKVNASSSFGSIPELNYGQNVLDIRYADVLLMYAEVQARMGNNATAINYVNMVRARAGLSNINPGLTNAELLDAIFMERSLEFALEGKRFLDIVRWGKGTELLGAYGYEPKDSIWPIPAQIIGENSLITQNPGYGNESKLSNSLVPEKNDYAPVINFPWIRVIPEKVSPTVMKQYEYNYCMDDSVLRVQAEYGYNADTLMNSYTESFNDASGNLNELYRETYAYDDSDRLSEQVKMTKISGVWDTTQIEFIRYPDDSTIIDSIGQYTINTGIVDSYEVYQYTWNNQDNSYLEINNFWSSSPIKFTKSDYTPTSRYNLSYNADNQITNILIKNYDQYSGTWSDVGTVYNTYLDGVLIHTDRYSYSNLTDQIFYHYNADKKLILEEDYNNSNLDMLLELQNGTQYNYPEGTYEITKTPLQYLSLTEDLHHIRQRTFYDTEEEQNQTPINSIEKSDANTLRLSPNPAKDFITLENNLVNENYYVFNALGVKVKSGILQSKSQEIEIRNLPDGIYTVAIYSKGKYYTKKFIKQ